jgi:hypothetical protein
MSNTGVELLKIVTDKLNDNETPEYLTPKGNRPTKIENSVDEISATKTEKIIVELITYIMFPVAKYKNNGGDKTAMPAEYNLCMRTGLYLSKILPKSGVNITIRDRENIKINRPVSFFIFN